LERSGSDLTALPGRSEEEHEIYQSTEHLPSDRYINLLGDELLRSGKM
jgi:hypothetical protein